MKPLAYDSAYDPYHTAFRMMRLCLYDATSELKVPKFRILDFYLNFPFLLKKYQNEPLPKGGKGQLNKINFEQYPEPYSDLPESQVIFRQMEVIQEAAMQTLCARNIIDENKFKAGFVSIQSNNIPDELKAKLEERNLEHENLLGFLVNFLGKIELEGSKGLKARTSLLEHRYDAV